MIDFEDAIDGKLTRVDPADLADDLLPVLVEDERPQLALSGRRTSVVFTDKRFICVQAHGVRGRRHDVSFVPLYAIQAWSVESSGTPGRNAKLELRFNGLGRVRLTVRGEVDLTGLNRMIGEVVL